MVRVFGALRFLLVFPIRDFPLAFPFFSIASAVFVISELLFLSSEPLLTSPKAFSYPKCTGLLLVSGRALNQINWNFHLSEARLYGCGSNQSI